MREHESAMDEFFACPGVRHRKTRDWNDGGQRHWFKLDPDLSVQQIRELLGLVPEGALVQCFDPHYDSPSDAGAWIAFQRYPTFWTATFSNHGWSSAGVPVEFEDAVLIFWEGRDFDYCRFLGVRDDSELTAHSGLSTEPPKNLDADPQSQFARFLRARAAAIRLRLKQA